MPPPPLPPPPPTQSMRPPSSSGMGSRPPQGSNSGSRTAVKKSELLCRVKWNNTLPDLPFDPKFIMYPFDSDRFKKYKPTSLEKEYKHDLLTEHDLGVNIDLISPETYGVPSEGLSLAPEDERLMEEDTGTSGDGGIKLNSLNEKRSKQHNLVVPWLKKTEYISTEFNRYGASSENNETKVGYYVQKKFKDDKEKMICMDKEGQIAAINKTFEEAKKPIKQHHSKKNVYAVEECPLFPDFDHWKLPFAQVSFDAEPINPEGSDGHLVNNRLMCEAIIRGGLDAAGEQYVAYFLPTQETLHKRAEDSTVGIDYDPDQEYIYQQWREYNPTFKNKMTRGYDQNYFFVKRDDAFYYNELETRVKLTKRRSKAASASAKLIVRHRPFNESDLKVQSTRLNALKPQIEDKNEDFEEEEGGDDKAPPATASGDEAAKHDKAKSSDSEEEKSPVKETQTAKRDKRKSSAESRSASDDESSSSGSASSGSSSSSDSDSASSPDRKKQKTKSKPSSKEVYSSESD